VIEIELNAATDNPLIFDRDEIYSGGNFHGEPIGFVADFMKIAVAELAAISERRTFRLVDVNLNHGLPAMLVDSEEEAGLNSGYMMPQYTAASLVLENQTLANPDSIHSMPTSASQEDHNANSMTAARHARQVVENARKVLAIEMLCAARAIELRLSQVRDSKLGSGSRKAFETIRAAVPPSRGDQYWQPHIKAIEEIITNREFDI
jgi:histidine ammonia-lyase